MAGRELDVQGNPAETNATEPLLPTLDNVIVVNSSSHQSAQPDAQMHRPDSHILSEPNEDIVEDDAEARRPSTDGTTSLVGIKISYDLTPFSSTLSSLHPVCRICQSPGEKKNTLLTPCRCDGSLKYVHGTCLRRWIEIRLRRKKYEYPRNCELCGYLYRKRKFIKCVEWKMPRVSMRDRVLHVTFLLCLIAMVTCAIVTAQHLIYDSINGGAHRYKTTNGKSSLSVTELITLTCGVVFFITFMIAVTVEIKAKRTIYDIVRKIVRHNTVWVIENYDKKLDAP